MSGWVLSHSLPGLEFLNPRTRSCAVFCSCKPAQAAQHFCFPQSRTAGVRRAGFCHPAPGSARGGGAFFLSDLRSSPTSKNKLPQVKHCVLEQLWLPGLATPSVEKQCETYSSLSEGAQNVRGFLPWGPPALTIPRQVMLRLQPPACPLRGLRCFGEARFLPAWWQKCRELPGWPLALLAAF